MSTNMTVPPASVLRPRSVRITKEMLGIQTRKNILYLDHNFFSSVYRGNAPQWNTAMQRITELLDLQLVSIPYSSTHEAEADFYTRRDDLVQFIQRVSRGHHFEAYYRVEETQILKAFQAYVANEPTTYIKEERDALPSSVHDWDDDYSVSVFRAASGVERKRQFKERAVDELLHTLSNWAESTNSFEQDMELELRDAGRILMEQYAKKKRSPLGWRLFGPCRFTDQRLGCRGYGLRSLHQENGRRRRAGHTCVLPVPTLCRSAVSAVVGAAVQHV